MAKIRLLSASCLLTDFRSTIPYYVNTVTRPGVWPLLLGRLKLPFGTVLSEAGVKTPSQAFCFVSWLHKDRRGRKAWLCSDLCLCIPRMLLISVDFILMTLAVCLRAAMGHMVKFPKYGTSNPSPQLGNTSTFTRVCPSGLNHRLQVSLKFSVQALSPQPPH